MSRSDDTAGAPDQQSLVSSKAVAAPTAAARALILTQAPMPKSPTPISTAAWATYVNIWSNPSINVANAQKAGIRTMAYVDFNKCSGSTFQDKNGNGANTGAEPDCSKVASSAFYQPSAKPTGSSDIFTCLCGGAVAHNVIQAYGDPNSEALASASNAFLNAHAKPDDNYVLVDNVFDLDEQNVKSMCVGIGVLATPGPGYTCPPSQAITNMDTQIAGYSASSWITGEEKITQNLPLPALLNGLNGCSHPDVSCTGTTAGSQVIAAAADTNVVGGLCDVGCFGAHLVTTSPSPVAELNTYEVQEQLSSVAAVVSAKKMAVILSDTLDVPSRETSLAAQMLVYDSRYSYEDNQNCGLESGGTGIPICPEAALVFVGDSPVSASIAPNSNGVLTRTGTCYIGGVQLIGECFTELNENHGGSVSTGYNACSGTASGPCAYALNIAGDDYAGSAISNYVDFTGAYPSQLLTGQGAIGLVRTMTKGAITAKSVAIGSNGQVWVIGSDGYVYAQQTNATVCRSCGFTEVTQPVPGGTPSPMSATSIAVDQTGDAWTLNASNELYKYTGPGWTQEWTSSSPYAATAIGIGGNSGWVLGDSCTTSSGGCQVYPLNLQTATLGSPLANAHAGDTGLPYGPTISVNASGHPYVVSSHGNIYHYNGASYYAIDAPSVASGIVVSANATIWALGYTPSCNTSLGGCPVLQKSGKTFVQDTSSTAYGTSLAVDQNGIPWIVNQKGQLLVGDSDASTAAFKQVAFP